MDTLTKDKIDTVLTSPDVLAPMIFPQMYDKYSYLRKERDLHRAASDAAQFSALTAISADKSNPLGISEEVFRASAKEAATAIELLEKHAANYFLGMNVMDPSVGRFVRTKSVPFSISDEDCSAICHGLGQMKNVVYAIGCYQHLIHQDNLLHTGLSNKELCAALFVYTMMDYQEISVEDYYYTVTGNALLNQAFQIVMKERYSARLADKQKFARMINYTTDEKDLMEIWFAALGGSMLIRGEMFSLTGEGCDGRFSCHRLERCAAKLQNRIDKTFIKSKFTLINGALYFENCVDSEALLKEEAPELKQSIDNNQNAMQQLINEISHMKDSALSNAEKEKTTEIEALRRKISSNASKIAELDKVKLFGKKKAKSDIAELNGENDGISKQIDAKKAELRILEENRRKQTEAALAELNQKRNMLEEEKQALDKQKSEYLSAISKWQYIGEEKETEKPLDL